MRRQATPVRPARLASARTRLGGVALLPFFAVVGLLLFEFSYWDKISPGVSALGTPIGGLSREQAVSRLSPGVQQLLDRPLDIRGPADQTWHTTARDLGLRLDPAELVGAAYQVGRSGNPVDRLGEQLGALVRGHGVSADSTTDLAALDASLGTLARQIDRPPRDAKLALVPTGGVEASGAEAGLALDIVASREHVAAALNGGDPRVDLVTRSVAPAIPDDQVRGAYEQLDRLLGPNAQPLTLTFGDQSWRLEQGDLVKLLSLTGATRPGQPAVVNIDAAPLEAWAAKLAKEVDQQVQDARFRFAGGGLQVLRPSMQGRTVDQAATVDAVRSALLSGAATVALPVSIVEPEVSSDNTPALGITELIDRGNTSFAGSIPEKKWNIKLAAERINGTIVPPGGTFSFNKAVGPTTLAAGFKWGFGITSGDDGPKTVPSVAGGICQVATTLFQPVFWSGLPLEERYWHLYWIPAYTSRGVVGLDVTVDAESGVDFKWTNPTSSYILVQADSDDERVYFGLYGKKPDWTVQVDDAVITNRTPPDTRPLAQEEPTLPWGRTLTVETARDGFDVEVSRRVIPGDGSKPRELNLKSTYQPAHTVTLVGSAGKPASASINDAITRVLEAQKPRPTPVPGASATAAAAVSGSPGANGTPGAAVDRTPAPAVVGTPAPKPAIASTQTPPQATPKPQVQATQPPAPARTPTPTRR